MIPAAIGDGLCAPTDYRRVDGARRAAALIAELPEAGHRHAGFGAVSWLPVPRPGRRSGISGLVCRGHLVPFWG
jgi:hypothetical protein